MIFCINTRLVEPQSRLFDDQISYFFATELHELTLFNKRLFDGMDNRSRRTVAPHGRRSSVIVIVQVRFLILDKKIQTTIYF